MLAVAHGYGGPPWTLVAVATFLLLAFTDPLAMTLGLLAPSLVWLAIFRITGDREFFFPYCMHLAVLVACRFSDRGRVWAVGGGAAVVACFLAIRAGQRATLAVLGVEVAVAAAILVGASLVRPWCPRRAVADAAIVATSSLLACAGLAL